MWCCRHLIIVRSSAIDLVFIEGGGRAEPPPLNCRWYKCGLQRGRMRPMRRHIGGCDFGRIINRRTRAHATIDGMVVTIVMATRPRSASLRMHCQYLARVTECMLCCLLNLT